jgi:hypothetical protein
MFAWAACRVGHQCGGGIHNQTVRQAVEYCTCISVVWRDDRWNKERYTDE